MRWMMAMMAALTAALLMPGMARAERPAMAEPVFASGAVGDAVLATTRGQAGFATLTIGGAVRLLDAQTRADFRQSGSIARVTMDIWWGSTGAALIAASVRGAGAP